MMKVSVYARAALCSAQLATALATKSCHRALSTSSSLSHRVYRSFVQKTEGEAGKEGFSITYTDPESGEARSPWHDVPLQPGDDGTYTFLCEFTKTKEGSTDENESERMCVYAHITVCV